MINLKLMNEIKRKLKVSDQRVYQRIKAIRKDFNYGINRHVAAGMLAGELGIDIQRYLPENMCREVAEKTKAIAPVTSEKKGRVKKNTCTEKKIIFNGRNLAIVDPLLPQKIIDEALAMEKIYPIVYLFENSARILICTIMEKNFGKNWWTQVPDKVNTEVEKRLKKEKETPWHGKRGQHQIYYTTMPELRAIMFKHWKRGFHKIFKQPWIETVFDSIENSRNVIAHNNPLGTTDQGRLEIYFKDWQKTLKANLPALDLERMDN